MTIVAIVVVLYNNNLIGRLITKKDYIIEKEPSSMFDSSINDLLDKTWEYSNYVTSEYVKNVIYTGIRRYNNEGFCAGALYE